jgi:hypothetical protein
MDFLKAIGGAILGFIVAMIIGTPVLMVCGIVSCVATRGRGLSNEGNKSLQEVVAYCVVWGATVGGFMFVYISSKIERRKREDAERRRLEAEEYSRREHLQRHLENLQRQIFGLRQNCMDAQSEVLSLPVTLGAAELALDRAEAEIAEGLPVPFWEAMEEATAKLQEFHGSLGMIAYRRSRHTSEAPQLGTLAPPFLLESAVVPDPALTHDRLRQLYRRAHKDKDRAFATIYEQRRTSAKVDQTNAILVAGFSSLGDAVERLGVQVCDAIRDLQAEIKFRLADLQSALESAAEAAAEQREAILTEMRTTREIDPSILEQLRGDASQRAEHERATRTMLNNIQLRRRPSRQDYRDAKL